METQAAWILVDDDGQFRIAVSQRTAKIRDTLPTARVPRRNERQISQHIGDTLRLLPSRFEVEPEGPAWRSFGSRLEDLQQCLSPLQALLVEGGNLRARQVDDQRIPST